MADEQMTISDGPATRHFWIGWRCGRSGFMYPCTHVEQCRAQDKCAREDMVEPDHDAPRVEGNVTVRGPLS